MKEIHIDNPCNVGWNTMKPSSNGRFCDSCSLTVVDFTKMSNEEIQNYFLEKSGERVCGHYRNDQISTPKLIRRKKRWGWLVTVITIIFGTSFISSCRRHTTGYRSVSDVRVMNFAQEKNLPQHEQNSHK